jgi:hypothetical protein
MTDCMASGLYQWPHEWPQAKTYEDKDANAVNDCQYEGQEKLNWVFT